MAVGRAEGTTTVNIPEGGLTDVDQLAQILYDSGAINKPEFFSLYCKITMDEEELSWISSGAYELETNKDYEDLINTLQGGNEVKEEVTVTIPEGYNALEIAAVLEENEVCDAQEFLDYLNTGDFTNYEEVAQIGDTSGRYYALEGYLFPDTYTFYKNDDLDMVIGKMLNNFHEKMTEDILNSVAQSDYTLDEIITLASIIQNEAADSNDMYKVSAVLHNRLEWGGQQDIYVLGCDSTVYYPYRNAAAVPTSDALSYGNYNTYDIQGLPPGPSATRASTPSWRPCGPAPTATPPTTCTSATPPTAPPTTLPTSGTTSTTCSWLALPTRGAPCGRKNLSSSPRPGTGSVWRPLSITAPTRCTWRARASACARPRPTSPRRSWRRPWPTVTAGASKSM